MATLHDTINSLAAEFAHELLRALRVASLDEILAETSAGHAPRRRAGRPQGRVADGGGEVAARGPAGRAKRSKRLARRSSEDLSRIVNKLVEIVMASKSGINAEGIKAALGIDRRELPRPLGMALKSGRIKKKGQKRATTYFAGGGSGGSGRGTPNKVKPAAKKRRAKPLARKTPKRTAGKRTVATKGARAAERAAAPQPKAANGAPVPAPAPVATASA